MPLNLLDYLRKHASSLPHIIDAQTGAVEVHGDLDLANSSLSELVETLTVHGSLDISRTPITRLPRALTVHGRLSISGTGIQELPQNLCVRGEFLMHLTPIRSLPAGLRLNHHISLADSAIDALPEGLVVQGTLNLRNAPIPALPEGLDVARDLILWHTRIQRLPSRLHVGGLIAPPPGLLDMAAFMRGQPEVVKLALSGTHHQRMQMHQQLRPFPDLWRVMSHLPPDRQLRIQRVSQEEFLPEFQWIDS